MKLTNKNKAACSAITKGFYRVMEKGVRPITDTDNRMLLSGTVLTSSKKLIGD